MKKLLTVIIPCLLLLTGFTSCNKELVTASFTPKTKAFHDYQSKKTNFPPAQNLSYSKNEISNSITEETKKTPTDKQTKKLQPKSETPIERNTRGTNKTKEKRKANHSKRKVERLKKHISRLEKSTNNEQSFSFSALASFLYGVLCLIPYYNIFFGIPALLAGFLTLKKMKENPEAYRGKGFAIAGIVLAFLGLLITVAIIVVIAILFSGGVTF